MESGMMALSEIRTSLARIKTVDEAKDLRDKAQAVQAYLQQSGASLEIQNDAAEIRLRAERRIGEILATSLRGAGNPQWSHSETIGLKDAGVSKTQSSRWQSLAKMESDVFDQHITDTREAKKELTTAALLKLARRQPETVEYEADEADPNVIDDLALLAGQEFGTVYADPPWRYGNQATRASTDNHYDTMTVEDICGLPVEDIVAENAHLHLWTTNAFLFEAKRVIDAWGFTYKSCFIWTKPQMGIGNYWRVSHEFMLFAIRGKAPFGSHSEMSWRAFNRGKHSKKPDEIRGIVERVSPGPRLEMFGRQAVPGWTVFGNQVNRSFQRTL